MDIVSKKAAELEQLLGRLCNDDLGDDGFRRLVELLHDDFEAQKLYVRYLDMHQSLREIAVGLDDRAALTEMRTTLAHLIGLDDKAESATECLEAAAGSESPPAPQPITFDEVEPKASPGLWGHFPVTLFAVLLLAVVSVAIAFQLGRTIEMNRPAQRHLASVAAQPESPKLPLATLVNVTNCRWDARSDLAQLRNGNQLHPGQSLSLLEGIAEIVSTRPGGGTARFVLEGPLALVVTDAGAPMLQYGKLSAVVASQGESLVLETPMGSISVSGYGSIGVVAAPDDVVIHAFAGEGVVFQPAWSIGLTGDEASFRAPVGDSLRLTADPDGELHVDHGDANEQCFVANLPMNTSGLTISNQYVAAIREAKPLAYWRFEALTDGLIRNEVDDQWHCSIQGEVNWRDYPGNRAVEVGTAANSGQFMTEDTFGDRLRKAYSLEAWVKPSHIHLGSVVGLVDWSSETPNISRHGLSLELCGPASPWLKPDAAESAPPSKMKLPQYHPGCFRFLHRSPVGKPATQGTSCYSPAPYAPRKWQHVVGTKSGKTMRLFVNGQLVGESQDSSDCPDDLRVIIGQNFPIQLLKETREREFVGELDEVAIYDRPLNEEEVKKHYELAQPDAGLTSKGT